jgi:hypothetical protein
METDMSELSGFFGKPAVLFSKYTESTLKRLLLLKCVTSSIT